MLKGKHLVTGAAGMIGSHLCRRLVGMKCEVVGVDNLLSGSRRNVQDLFHSPYFAFVNNDLRHPSCAVNVMKGVDYVWALAANMGGVQYINTVHADIMRDNALINLNTLEAARKKKVKGYFYSSSACIYPSYLQIDAKVKPLKESDAYPAEPDQFYGWEKLLTEKLCEAYQKDYKMNIRIARFHNIYGHCYDKETQVLTREGFKYFENVSPEDEIATLNDITDKVEYCKPSKLHRYAYKGKMFHIKHSHIDLMVTPDQNLYCAKNFRHKYALQLASDILSISHPHNIMFRLDFPWQCERKSPLFVTLDAVDYSDGRTMANRNGRKKRIAIEDWLEFLGWYISEGSSFVTPSNYVVDITQKDTKVQKHIVDLFKRMGFNCYVINKDVKVHAKQIYMAVKKLNLGHCRDKHIPREYMDLPKNKLMILYKALMAGDGDKRGNRYSTISYQLACDFQELAMKIGKTTNLIQEGNIYRVFLKDNTKVFMSTGLREEMYDGMVYDVTVPNHIIMVRRNGKTVWSGNCYTAFDKFKAKAPCHMIIKAIRHPNPGMVLWGDGKATRSFCYIDDCIDGILKLMESDYPNPVNIGSDRLISVDDLAKLIIGISGKNIVPTHDLAQPQGVRGRNASLDLVKQVLGWEPKVSLEDGLKRVYQWAESHFSELENI